MKTCDRCKHYTVAKPFKFDKEHEFAGACALMGDVNNIACPKDGAVGWDAESYSAGVYVGPKFGCVHWSKK
jgi:hypothetical protein